MPTQEKQQQEETAAQNGSSALVRKENIYSDEELGRIKSIADAVALAESHGQTLEEFSDYGTGFVVVEKDTLLGVPFMILDWRFTHSKKYDGLFVSIMAIRADNSAKVIFNDGSLGIRQQLENVTSQRRDAGQSDTCALAVRTGLKKNTYTTKHPETGKDIEAETYYLA